MKTELTYLLLKTRNAKAYSKSLLQRRTCLLMHFLSSDEPIAVQYKRWKRNVNIAIHAHIRKIRLTETKQDTKIEVLMNERKNIMKKKTLSKSEEKKVHEI